MPLLQTAPLRVAAIGRTGRGDWGHAIDELWQRQPGTEMVAVADESTEGLAKAASASAGTRRNLPTTVR